MNEDTKRVDAAVRLIREVCSRNARLRRLPKPAQIEIQEEILVKMYIRQKLDSPAGYVSNLLKFELINAPYRDPFISRERKRFHDRSKWGLPVHETGTTRRSPEQSALDALIVAEQEATKQEQGRRIVAELSRLLPRQEAVIIKYCRGEKLTHQERSLKLRAIKVLRTRLNPS
jgi:hypothetical protein